MKLLAIISFVLSSIINLSSCSIEAPSASDVATSYWSNLTNGEPELARQFSVNGKINALSTLDDKPPSKTGHTLIINSKTIKIPTTLYIGSQDNPVHFDTVVIFDGSSWKVDTDKTIVPTMEQQQATPESSESLEKLLNDGSTLLQDAIREGGKELNQSLRESIDKLNKQMEKSIESMKKRREKRMQEQGQDNSGEGLI